MQLALLVAVEQVGQAVIELADHQQHAHRLGGVVQFPVHVELAGDIDEALPDRLDIAGETGIEAEHRAHEEGAADLVVELRHLADVATVVGEEGSHAGDDAGSGRAADLDHVLVLSVLHVESSGGGGSGCKAENLSVKPEFIPEYF
ncbi:hypothetical protein D3C86_1669620 [compost metagenome]